LKPKRGGIRMMNPKALDRRHVDPRNTRHGHGRVITRFRQLSHQRGCLCPVSAPSPPALVRALAYCTREPGGVDPSTGRRRTSSQNAPIVKLLSTGRACIRRHRHGRPSTDHVRGANLVKTVRAGPYRQPVPTSSARRTSSV
jgi:hypothetical protein